jgi:hypothetical protein
MRQSLDIPVPRSHPDYMRYYTALNKERMAEIKRKSAANNRERRRESWKKWYHKNEENKTKKRIKNQFEKAEKLKRIPSWSDRDAIAEFYRNCPEGYHVDHIIPLRGKTVSGLHVLENLQYLLAEDNLRKSNKFIGEQNV